MAESEIDYAALLQRGLRSVVREVLARTEREGLPGEHHFYLSLRTDHPDTQAPPFLRQRFPEEITVVLQHQFRDLVVDDLGFAVTLRFDGMPARLVVPWEAVVAFFDPTAEFGLRFDTPALAGAATTGAAATRALRPAVAGESRQADAPATPKEATPSTDGGGDEPEVAKVLSFGRPRDRRDGD